MKVQDTQVFYFGGSTDDNVPVLLNFLDCIIYNCKTQIDFSFNKIIKYYWLIITFPWKMTTRNKRKLAALNKENCEEHPRSNLAQNSSAPRPQEDYITQVSEEIEGMVTKRLSKEFSRTENQILGA